LSHKKVVLSRPGKIIRQILSSASYADGDEHNGTLAIVHAHADTDHPSNAFQFQDKLQTEAEVVEHNDFMVRMEFDVHVAVHAHEERRFSQAVEGTDADAHTAGCTL
jgi:Asp-tRNA(Asn)/Glu-tRNA(Gln) amidotransferase B subunit